MPGCCVVTAIAFAGTALEILETGTETASAAIFAAEVGWYDAAGTEDEDEVSETDSFGGEGAERVSS